MDTSLLPSRRVNLADSKVTIGAVAKGRSASFPLNGQLRVMSNWLTLGRKSLSNLYTGTKHNSADYPSRKRPLPAPEPMLEWLDPLVDFQPPTKSYSSRFPHEYRGLHCWEAFAGHGGLSEALHQRGCHVSRPLEAFPSKNVYVSSNDLDNDRVFHRLEAEILAGFYKYLHFGIPCKTWGAAGEGYQEIGSPSRRWFSRTGNLGEQTGR